MKILTPAQEALLGKLGKTEAADRFVLTGGTALAAFYLEHRYSEDLDLFTGDEAALPLARAALERIAAEEGAALEFTRSFPRFLRCFFTPRGGEALKLDLAVDSPYRLEPPRATDYGVCVDNPLDISCNKLSALFERAAGKDFVDLFFIHRELIPFDDLLPKARHKHVGMDDYWLALSLARVSEVQVLPRMIKPVTLEDLNAFFIGLSDDVMKKARPPG